MKKTLLTLIAFLLSLTAFSQIPNYVPQNGLVGWWPFNGNANDESGNGNNGTVNGATLTTDRFGNANQAYGFDGVDDYISSIRPGYLSYSISVWYKIPGPMAPMIYPIVDGFDSYFEIYFTNQGLFYASFTGINQYSNVNCNLPLTQDQWEHLILVYENNTIFIYSNSVLVYTSSVQPLTGITGNHFFGASLSGTDQYLNGSLDDIGIWNRALTACEIQNLYQSQSQAISAGADQSICSGDLVTLNGSGGSTYQWNNNVVDGQAFTPNQSANYVVNGTDSLGCQGTDTVVVTVLENAVSTLTQTALDSYTLNGQTYTQSGTYTQTLTAANGCDSTITLNLTLNFTGIDELGTNAKKLVNITDLNGKTIPRRKNTLMLFIYEDGTVERVVEMEE
jgi:hypothetical protein